MSEHNGLSTAEAVRAAGSRQVRRYKLLEPLPVNGLRLRIQSLTEQEMSKYQTELVGRGNRPKPARLEDANGRLFCRVLVDGDGNRLFGDGDAEAFAGWDSADTGALYERVKRHLGLEDGDVEDLVKNSAATGGDARRSGSPSGSPGDST